MLRLTPFLRVAKKAIPKHGGPAAPVHGVKAGDMNMSGDGLDLSAGIAPTATILLRGVTLVDTTRLFTPFGPAMVKYNPAATYLQFDSRADATLALEAVRSWRPDVSVEYCTSPPLDWEAFSPTRLSQDERIQWCRNAGVNASLDGDTIKLTMADPYSSSTVPDTLFPLAPSTGEYYDQFYTMLRGALRQEGGVYTLPVAAVTHAMIADENTWAPFFKIQSGKQRKDCIARQLERAFGIEEDSAHVWAPPIALKSRESLLFSMMDSLETALKAWEEWDQPLRDLLKDPGFLKSQTKLAVITKQDYTTDPRWRPQLPAYWVSEDTRLLKRAERAVFKHLVVTATLEKLSTYNVAQRMVLIDGESGSGKTCALFASACGTTEQYDLHFVTTASRVFPDITCDDVVGRVRGYVHTKLRELLARSRNNTDQPLRVLLYLDEVGANMVEGEYSVSGVSEYMRDLIKKFSELRTPAVVGKDGEAVSMSITIVAAGTGMEDMYGGEGGSIAGQYTTLRVKPPREEALRNMIAKYIKKSAVVDALLHCEEMHVLCTNARFLAYTLHQLQQLIESDALKLSVEKPYILEELEQRAQRSPDSLGVTPEAVSTLVRRLLPEACAYAARSFMSANGLAKLSPMERQVLLQAAHVALLKRTVLVSGKDEQALSLVDAGLRGAGFTPMRRPVDLKGHTDVKMVVTGSAAGLYTTTKVAGKLSPDHVAAGCEWTIKDETHCVMVPTKEPPVVMSEVYRVLPRLLDRSFFSAMSPDDFEEVSTVVICEALRALATQDGGCDYPTLLAAVLGADYGLPYAKGRVGTATRRLTFHHVVRVRLPFLLGKGGDTSARVRRECAAALETHLSDWLETCGGMKGAELVRQRLKDLRAAGDDLEKKHEHMQRVMFVVTPAPRSPSPDLVLMCVGKQGEDYLGVAQFKRNTIADPTKETMEQECMKNGAPVPVKKSVNDAKEQHSTDPKVELIKKRGEALRSELESCSGTKETSS